ncbi:MAG: thiamine pyrophosphate-dependent enzyme [Acidibrevibacterium sp.]|jgi:thiamine pyrophosphate-dependent acetolactate synthase large subunit-like protein|uniref:thiamine pyrophosphate-dependent enzyme n=1 Tax=Acidibrevibacterium fodinaquatile TaxID=1969806 RepID=UPI0023A89F16|nr:thiamine pyrophosphate-dependent enzyme [Acidibrevibacterium fodinaquatile]MCA7118725.1 thiamine pyrophosphate-dependent enzyme [Acidibrevibacterium fodinaquatile]
MSEGLDRRAVVAALLARRRDLLVVTGLGSASYDVAACGDRVENFYLWGAMGGAAMVGLGLALAQPERRVLVVTGDGEMLMGLGALATIAVAGARNLAIVVLDNRRYGETGAQLSHTAHGVNLAAIAKGCGWENTSTIVGELGLDQLARAIHRDGPLFAVIRIAPGEKPRVLPPRDGAFLTQRFRAGLGLAEP